MKPEISTAVMIERVREMAADSSDSQDRVLFTQAANRIELLLAAESGMSREMACIRHALDIPPDQSVQSGVVDAFVRLNAKIQDLSGQLSKPGNARWCPSVDPISGSKLFLWLEHPTLGCVPTYGGPYDSFTLTERDENGDFFRHRYDHDEGAWVDDEAVYLEEQEGRQGQAYTVPDERAAYEAFIAKRLGDSIDTQRAKNGDPEKPDYMAWDMTVGWIAWQGRAAMPQPSSNSTVSSALVAENLALKEIIDRVTDLDNEPQYHESGMGCGLEDRNITDRYEAMRHGWDAAMERVYGEVIPCAEELSFPATEQAARELMAKGVDQAASGFHEKAFVAFDSSNYPGLYIRAQLQLLAQQLRDGDA
ncbi:hypothetical protein [Pectobacterium carotovorum]|uniref:hypothetical protein n=1 Tax=Pectobacterium carotovorum TaxID=554 RepID=UPI00027E0AE1|nr:hypothetical protein [Pectobacterium carotovorum]AFR03261.1 hypothetical protein PCC21_018580 [Pectobacterium carotovorum subsp. carotovorum PCC21]